MFRRNDYWEEMRHEVHTAKERGFDELARHITTEPEGFPSTDLVPGTSQYAPIERDIFRDPYPSILNALTHVEDYM